MENFNRKFEGIWIPKELWFDQNLTLQEKIFFIEINSLDNDDGCFATNEYFANFFGISRTRVSLIIKSLIDKKYIKSTMVYKENSKEIERRVLNICYTPYLTKVKYPYLTKVKDPIQQKLKDNNTINNTVLINKEKKEKSFILEDNTVLEDIQFIDILLKKNNIEEIKRVIVETINYHKTINNNISYLKLKEHIVNKLNKEKKEKEKKEKKKDLTFGSTFQRGNFL